MEYTERVAKTFDLEHSRAVKKDCTATASTKEILEMLMDFEGRERQQKEFIQHLGNMIDSIGSLMDEYPLLQAEGCIVSIDVRDGYGMKLVEARVGNKGFVHALVEKHPELKDKYEEIKSKIAVNNELAEAEARHIKETA